MKFMMMMHYSGEGEPIHTWPPAALQAHIRFMLDLNETLKASGELVDAQGLAGPDQAKIVRSRGKGQAAITDGPFPESKEFLAGFWIVDVESEKRAIEIAAMASAAPGMRGEPMGIAIELRQVMTAPKAEV